MAAGQKIETDPKKWLAYEVDYGGGKVWLSVPPNHRFKELPQHLVRPFEASAPRMNQIFTAQYDYGWLRWKNISEFEVTYTVVKLTQALPADVQPLQFREAITRTVETATGRSTIAANYAAEAVADGVNRPWIRAYNPSDELAEWYATLCRPDLALIVTPWYLGEKLRQDPEWRANRRALLRQLLGPIRCQ